MLLRQRQEVQALLWSSRITERKQWIDIELHPADCKAVVTIDSQLFTEYRYGHYVCRPYFYPVLTPSGTGLTRAYPMEGVEGENQDHYHHRGLYTAPRPRQRPQPLG